MGEWRAEGAETVTDDDDHWEEHARLLMAKLLPMVREHLNIDGNSFAALYGATWAMEEACHTVMKERGIQAYRGDEEALL